jgi:hypothetical protein
MSETEFPNSVLVDHKFSEGNLNCVACKHAEFLVADGSPSVAYDVLCKAVNEKLDETTAPHEKLSYAETLYFRLEEEGKPIKCDLWVVREK